MKKLAFASFIVLALTTLSVFAAEKSDQYDRLDGRGASGVKVDVIEWEGNLEVHVYPAGSLKSLAAKLDLRDRNKPVMVLGLRFKHQPQTQLVRRAILGVPFREGFLAFRDPNVADYDKVILSNNGLSADLKKFELEPGPSQLYPDGHPANEVAGGAAESARVPASAASGAKAPYLPPQRDSGALGWKADVPAPQRPAGVDENGAIRPFEFR